MQFVFKMLEENNCQNRILYPEKIILKNEVVMETSSDKQKQNY